MVSPRSPGAPTILVWIPREEKCWHKPVVLPTYPIVVNGTLLSDNKFNKERREGKEKEGKKMTKNRSKEGRKSLLLCHRTSLFTQLSLTVRKKIQQRY